MPQNLNALIRYKTIDRCLRNRFKPCTIEVLIENCSEALGEARGVYTGISERTVRDDLRVMKSDILGFEAPIKVKDGVYYYDDPDFSIFNVPIREKKVLEKVLEVLIENRQKIGYTNANRVIIEIAEITGLFIPTEIYDELERHTIRFSMFASSDSAINAEKDPAEQEAILKKWEIRKTIWNTQKLAKNAITQIEEPGIDYVPEWKKLGMPWLYHWSVVLDLFSA